MARIPGVPVTGKIVPTDTTDTFPVIDPVYGIGGWREVADVAARDAITSLRTRQGMIVYCVDGGSGSPAMFQWDGAAWQPFAGGDGTVTSVTVAGAQGVVISGTVPITGSGTATVGLGDITPSSVAATGTVSGSNLSGTNTGDQTITLTGDVTGSGTGSFATTIANGAISTTTLGDGTVTFPKIQSFTAHTLLGNPTGSTAVPSLITLGAGLAFSGSTLVAAGTGGTVTSVTAGSGLSGGTITTSGTIALSTIGNNSVLANISGVSAVPTSIAATALVDSAFGGAQGSVLYRGSSSWAALSPGTDGQVLTTHGTSANPTWSSTGGTVTSIATGTGLTGGPITGTGTISLAAIADLTVLANVSGSSNPPGSTTLTALIDDAIGSTQGDVLYRGASIWSVLAPGTSGQFLATQGAGANPQWASGGVGTVTSITTGAGLTGGPITGTGTVALAAIADADLLANTSGGALAPSATTLTALIDYAIGSTQGDVLYRSASAWSVLTPGTAGQVLTTQGASANPDWTSAGMTAIANNRVLANISGGSALPAADTLTAVIDSCIGSTQGDVLYRSATAWSALAPGTSGQLLTSGGAAANPSWTTVSPGTGTVTQVTFASTPSWLTGTIATNTTTPAITLVGTPAQTANLFLATPNGATGPVGLRAIALADLPTVTAAQGGTGLATLTAHAVLLGEGTSNVAFATIGTAGRILTDQGSGADPAFASTGLKIDSHYGAITADSISGGTSTLNLGTSDWHTLTLDHTGATTLALSGGTTGQQFTVVLVQDSTGSCLVTWFSGIKWPGGVVPTLTTAASKTDVFTFKQTGAGAYYGFVPGQNL